MKKAIGALLAAVMTMACVGCTPTPSTEPPVTETLTAPFNVKVSDEGVVTWVGDVNATEYIVTVDGVEHEVYTPYFYLEQGVDASFTIVARADGYGDSSPVTGQYKSPTVTVGIRGNSEVRPGGRLLLNARVTNAKDTGVIWEIVDGKEYATISANGTLTAAGDDKITSDRLVVVQATSKADPTVSARKMITVTARTALTQEMLDELAASEKMSFEGYVNIDLYTFGISETFYSSFISDIKTAMDGENWYAEYVNAATSISSALYFKERNGVANQVSVSLRNEESFMPMTDREGEIVSWENAGLYNSFYGAGLEVSDFEFSEKNWCWEYKGNDDKFIERVIASANPYDFIPKNLGLIITDGHIVGIQSEAEDDYTMVQQYVARQKLVAVVNVGDAVNVRTINKFTHDAEYDDIYNKLSSAVEKMQALTSYTVDFLNIGGSSLTSGLHIDGYTETITPEICNFRPFSQNSYGTGETVIRTYNDNGIYGYVKKSDALYNTYSYDAETSKYSANRAYKGDFKNAMPSFDFSAEIFRKFYVDDETGDVTYYSDDAMTTVASTFYRSVGNDMSLYGIYASIGRTSATESFTPYVTVSKDGYITEAGFYYYLGYVYGVVELEYSDFDSAEISAELVADLNNPNMLATREVPTAWDQLTIIDSPDSTATEKQVNALEYLKTFFGNDDIEQKLPFFGEALGDTYGFGMNMLRKTENSPIYTKTIVLYYDVPLDLDYSITSSITAVSEFLVENGFTKKKGSDIYYNDVVTVEIVDSSLDLNIYLWKTPTQNASGN